jgi:F-type H+-transporting ATPase subunit epsilon
MQLDIVTPRGTILSTEVDELVAPGALGEFGVLPGHIPFLTSIRPGVVRYRHGSAGGTIAVGSGFLEVAGSGRVILLAQQGALAESIDANTVRQERDAAQRQLDGWSGEDAVEREGIEARLAWAQARLDAAGGGGAPPAAH